MRIAASGVNFIDVYYRTGLYKAELPVTLGSEAAGTVDAVGADVTEVSPGDRVAYAMVRGSYAEYAVVPAAQLVTVPTGSISTLAAAVMLQGMTAHYLTHSTFPLSSGQTCLVHAAAGGRRPAARADGQGARARACSAPCRRERRRRLRRAAGVDHVILYTATTSRPS